MSRVSRDASETEVSTAPAWPPVWVRPAALVLAVLGLADSVYLTYEHYTGSRTLACSSGGLFNCHAVTTSDYSYLPPGSGIPVALLGLLFFVGMTALCLPQMWGRSRTLDRMRLAGLAVGVLMVLWLVYAELFRLGQICPYCTGVHVITVVLFGLVAVVEALRPLPVEL